MRSKIIAGNLATVLLVGAVSFFVVQSDVESALLESVDGRISSDYRLMDRSFRLSALDLSELVSEQASQRAMQDIWLAALDVSSRRTRAYESAERVATWLQDPSRRGAAPDIVVIIDEQGMVVARNADRNRMYQQVLRGQVGAVDAALRGEIGTGVWHKEDENKVLQVAAAPIQAPDGRVIGALLVGYDVSNGLARSESQVLGRDVAFVLGDAIYSSSFEESARAESLAAYLFGAGSAATTAAMSGSATSDPFTVQLGESEYRGVVGPAPGQSAGLAMVVLGNRSAQLERASSVRMILYLTLVGVLVVLIYGFLIGSSFIRPVEQMEETILSVINGRTDMRIDIESAEFGGLAYRINQLLNVFTGTPEEDDQGRVSTPPGANWQDDRGGAAAASGADDAGGAGVGDDAELAATLAAEPADAYYARVYQEYVAAKQAAGEDVSNIPQDKFTQRLQANEKSLVAKHGCRMVRFQVEAKGTQVNLKPVIIR